MPRDTGDIHRDDARSVDVRGQPLVCLVCKGTSFWTRTSRMESGGIFQQHSRFDDPYLRLLICSVCGHVHSFVDQGVGA